MFRLMIKTHNTTNKKYLCITKREKWVEYSGSGLYWLKHLKKHGFDFSTELLYESKDYKNFVKKCIYFSNYYDVALNEEFANLIPEYGYDNFDIEKETNNLVLWWQYASQELKLKTIIKRNKSIKKNHWIKTNDSEEIKQKISKRLIEYWTNFSEEEKLEKMKNFHAGFHSWYKDLSEEEKIKRNKNISKSVKQWYKNTPKEVVSEIKRNARLNTSEESKQQRKEKIQKVYLTGKHDKLFERYSKERKGGNNPAAVKIEIDGVIYNSIKDAIEETGLTRSKINNRLKSEKYQNFRRL